VTENVVVVIVVVVGVGVVVAIVDAILKVVSSILAP